MVSRHVATEDQVRGHERRAAGEKAKNEEEVVAGRGGRRSSRNLLLGLLVLLVVLLVGLLILLVLLVVLLILLVLLGGLGSSSFFSSSGSGEGGLGFDGFLFELGAHGLVSTFPGGRNGGDGTDLLVPVLAANGEDDTDTDGLTHVTDSETGKRSVHGFGFDDERLGRDETSNEGFTGLGTNRFLLDGLEGLTVELPEEFFEAAGNVGGVAIEDWGVTAVDFTRVTHDDDTSGEVSSFESRVVVLVGDDHTTGEVLGSELDVETDVVTRVSSSDGFVVHFDGLDLGIVSIGQWGKVSPDTRLEDTGFDTADWDSTDTRDLVDILEGETERLVFRAEWRVNAVELLDDGVTIEPGDVVDTSIVFLGDDVVTVETRDWEERDGVETVRVGVALLGLTFFDDLGGRSVGTLLAEGLGPAGSVGVELEVDVLDLFLDFGTIGELDDFFDDLDLFDGRSKGGETDEVADGDTLGTSGTDVTDGDVRDEVGGLEDFSNFGDDVVEDGLFVVEGIDLVDETEELLDTEGVGEEGVFAGGTIFGDTGFETSPIDDEDTDIGLSGTGDHVLDEILVTRSIDNGEVELFGGELPESDVNGDTTFTFGLELIKDPGVLERGLTDFGSFLFELFNLTLGDTTALENDVTGGGGLTSIDVTDDDEVTVNLVRHT